MSRRRLMAGACAALVVSVLLTGTGAACAEGLTAGEVVRLVNARGQGAQLSRTLEIELTDRRGQTRRQTVQSLRKDFGAERRLAIFYRSPANVRDTALLVHDHADAQDDQWLYLPSMRKVRRISAASRGDYFLGTDLTYDDIKNEGRLVADDYRFELSEETEAPQRGDVVLEGRPATDAIADTLGYSRVRWVIDSDTWMFTSIRMWDNGGNLLKTVSNDHVEQVQGIWTVTGMSVVNHKTGHATRFQVREIDYRTNLPDRYFDQSVLRRGI